jgi:superfamily I DNA/RNA helicase
LPFFVRPTPISQAGVPHPYYIVRYNALSRALEAALQRESIPNRVLSGVKFFERLEIKDLLAYLQLVDNPDSEPAGVRVINVPSRRIGEKVLSHVFIEIWSKPFTGVRA